jgi:hypothetical protein
MTAGGGMRGLEGHKGVAKLGPQTGADSGTRKSGLDFHAAASYPISCKHANNGTNRGGKGLDDGLVIAMGLPPRSILRRTSYHEVVIVEGSGEHRRKEHGPRVARGSMEKTVELGSNFRGIDAVTVRARASWQRIFTM